LLLFVSHSTVGTIDLYVVLVMSYSFWTELKIFTHCFLIKLVNQANVIQCSLIWLWSCCKCTARKTPFSRTSRVFGVAAGKLGLLIRSHRLVLNSASMSVMFSWACVSINYLNSFNDLKSGAQSLDLILRLNGVYKLYTKC